MSDTQEIIKSIGEMAVAPDGVGTNDCDFWFIATAEIKDLDGDVVRVKGIDTDTFHSPPTKYIPIMAKHPFPDRERQKNSEETDFPKVIGRVERFVKSSISKDGKDIPVLYAGANWARDGAGVHTNLAKAHKDLYDGGFLRSFSTGFKMSERPGSVPGGRYDITKSILYEVTSTPIPINALANGLVRKSLEDAGYDIPKEDYFLDVLTKAIANPDDKDNQLNKYLATFIDRKWLDFNKAIQDKLDDIESKCVAVAQRGTQPGNPACATSVDHDSFAKSIKRSLIK